MNLFFKIFLWFLGAMALMIFVALFLTWSMQSDPFIARQQNNARNQVRFHAETVGEIYDAEGRAGVERYLERLKGFDPIHGVALIAADRTLVVDHSMGPNIERSVVDRAFESGEVEADFPPIGEGIIASRLKSKDGRVFVLAVHWNRPAPPPFLGEPRVRYLRLIGLLLTAGLVCYVLARYLSGPIVKLGAATRAFANGDLATRVALGKRRDEFGKLAADFNDMAERIETLLTSEKRLTRDISHELRSPLARMNVALELAKQKSGPETKAVLQRIESESERLNEMVGKLLTLSKLESGSAGVSMVRFDLAKLVSAIVADANFEAEAKGKSVAVEASESCRIVGNEYLLRSAVENVVRNAVRYTGDGTTVNVKLSANAESAEITVEDRGGGVPEDELEKLFRPFYRVAEARERTTGGVGLGLAIARRAVLAHNGAIDARNTAHGLLVSIRLPLTDARQ